MKQFMPELDPAERIRVMQENAEHVEETTYYKDLQPEEVELKCKQFVDNSINVSQLEDELDAWKPPMAPLISGSNPRNYTS